MSHFTVMIFGDNPEEQLSPFQENNNGDCPEEYMIFNDIEEESLEEYENDSAEILILKNGKIDSPYKYEYKNDKGEFEYPEGSEVKTMKLYEIYPTFEEFMKKWHGYTERDEKNGTYGYWENEQAKWDWYELGGRWTGMFRLKEGSRGTSGEPGLMTKRNTDHMKADQCLKKDIDFEGMELEAETEANAKFDTIEKLLGEYFSEDLITWGELYNKEDGSEIYNEQPIIKKWKDSDESMWGCPIDEYCLNKPNPRESYVKSCVNSAFSTFAVLKDGKWYERGNMGWWGCVSDEKDTNDWSEKVRELINSVSDDTLISVYDCHI